MPNLEPAQTTEPITQQLHQNSRKSKMLLKHLLVISLTSMTDNLLMTVKCIKILTNLPQKYAILKPDKGNGIVLIKINNYKLCMTDLFSDTNKFMKVNRHTTLTQLTTLQTCLKKVLNHGEITNDEYNNVQPVYTRPA